MNKNELRKSIINIRNNINDEERNEMNKSIFTKFINSSFVNDYDTFLIYVSVKNEVDTRNLISYLLESEKKVAVPYCSNNKMFFYYIDSLNELINGAFGIPSVDIFKSHKAENFENALCIVPGVSFDNNCNRLGYGGGYYDRFLADKNVTTIGLCYERCIINNIPVESHDTKMDYVLTESCFRNNKNKEVSTYG